MTDKILDLAVVVLPTVLGILGLLFSLKVPREATHSKWRYTLVMMGLAISALTYWQQSRSRDSHAAEVKEHKEAIEKLQQMVEKAEAKREIESAFLRHKLDSKELAALSSAIRDYAQRERAKETLNNKQLRERAFTVIRKMREFQLRYDFQESEITRRFLQGLREAEKIGAAEMLEATEKPGAKEKLGPTEELEALRKKQEALKNKLEALQKRREEITKGRDKATQEEKAMNERYQAEFNSSLLAEAAYVRDEILKRLPPQPEPRPPQTMQILAFQGVLVGSRPVGSAANYLENLTKKLSP